MSNVYYVQRSILAKSRITGKILLAVIRKKYGCDMKYHSKRDIWYLFIPINEVMEY